MSAASLSGILAAAVKVTSATTYADRASERRPAPIVPLRRVDLTLGCFTSTELANFITLWLR